MRKRNQYMWIFGGMFRYQSEHQGQQPKKKTSLMYFRIGKKVFTMGAKWTNERVLGNEGPIQRGKVGQINHRILEYYKVNSNVCLVEIHWGVSAKEQCDAIHPFRRLLHLLSIECIWGQSVRQWEIE